jgi:hypothetical protein
MFRTEDNYSIIFHNKIDGKQIHNFRQMLVENDVKYTFDDLIDEISIADTSQEIEDFFTNSSYKQFRRFCFILFKSFGPATVNCSCVEDATPNGCSLNTDYYFYVDEEGDFDFSVENELWIDEDISEDEVNEECVEREANDIVGIENDFSSEGNIIDMDLKSFLKSLSNE